MIDVKKNTVKIALETLHKSVMSRSRRHGNEDIIKENRLYSYLCNDMKAGPGQCAIAMSDKYGYNSNVDDIIMMFRSKHIAHPKERMDIFQWANTLAGYFAEAISGDREKFSLFEKMRRRSPGHRLFNDKERILVLMIYERYPELNVYGDKESLMHMGSTLSRFFLYDFSDAVAIANGFPTYKDRTPQESDTSVIKNDVYGKGQAKGIDKYGINRGAVDNRLLDARLLERNLERTNMLLKELQDEFDEQIAASKTKELAEFFSKLNSDKYGCILDELIVLRKGMMELRKRNYELPIEINGLLILVKKLIQFVQDCHINPMMKVDSVQKVKAADVEFCNYEGSPFSSEEEVKNVRVISPGWIYKDKEVQISRPKLKEEV